MSGLIRDKLLKEMKLQSDEPNNSGDFFNFAKYADQISTLLQSESMISPFTIAIHAEWGMGKTTLLRMIKQKFDIHCVNYKVIEFNAWEYERLDVVTSLLLKIEDTLKRECNKETKKLGKSIGTLMMDVALRKLANISLEDVQSHFSDHERTISTLRETLEQLTKDTTLFLFIDDLDRCSTKNILEMLEAIKVFFNVKNIIVLMAIDMTKIERAWELQYNSDIGKIEGREHVEKIFPLKLALPPKSNKDMHRYVKNMAKSLSDKDVDFILHNLQFNPRKVKRMMNLLYIILRNLSDRGENNDEINKNFKVDFKMLIAWIVLTLNHPDIAKKIQLSPSFLIRISIICNRLQHMSNLKHFLELFEEEKSASHWAVDGIDVSEQIMNVRDIPELLVDIKNEPASFKIIKHFADQFDLDSILTGEYFVMNEESVKKFDDEFFGPLDEIINNAGLIGI